MISSSALPYRDRKSVGSADFYFAINSTFRFIRDVLGRHALEAYWTSLGREYLAPVSQYWKNGGLEAIANYWNEFFKAEPGAEFEISSRSDAVELEVKVCPAIKHLRDGGRTITPEFCQHCYFVTEAAAQQAGFSIRVQGGNGCCRQTFFSNGVAASPQQLDNIQLAK